MIKITSPIINEKFHRMYFPVVIASKNNKIRIEERIVEIHIIFRNAFSEITYLSFSSKFQLIQQLVSQYFLLSLQVSLVLAF